jgi:hypothetical protein
VQVAALKLTLGFNRDAFQRPLPELVVSGQRRSKLLLHPQRRRARDGQQGEGQAGKSDTAGHAHRRRRLHESARVRQGGHVTASDLGRCRQAILQYSDDSFLHHYIIIYYFKN